jgi:hypothetical protein
VGSSLFVAELLGPADMAAGSLVPAEADSSFVFYSGPGALDAATEWSVANNGTMIGNTAFGQAIENGTMTAAEASEAFANSASGTVQVFSNAPFTNFGNIWYNYELPALANNPSVNEYNF